MDTTIVAIGPLCWGKGVTQEQAVKNAKRSAPGSAYLKKGKHAINVYRVVGFKGVSDMNGAISYDRDGSCEKVGEAVLLVRGN